MNIKGLLLLVLFFFSISLFVTKIAQAFNLQEALTSENSIVVKVQEGIEYFFAFKVENKVAVLEKHAEKRLAMAQGYAEKGNKERVQSLMQNYLQKKERQNDLLGKTNDDGEVLGKVEERTIEQQKTIEKIKTKIDEDGKQNVIQVQEQVVNQVAERIVEVNGKEGQTEFFNKVEHVWAPGTGPGGEAGVVVVGGAMQFAPGTSAGGNATSDIKTVEIKTVGDHPNTEEPVGSGGSLAPDTSAGGANNTIDSGGVDSGNTSDSKTWIAP